MPSPLVYDREIRLNGLRFHYRDWVGDAGMGEKSRKDAGLRPTLVLLHGFTGHARSWDPFAEEFQAAQAGYRILALDQRGHGETDWAPAYSAKHNLEDLAAFVDALELQGFVLLGHSMGGACAFAYAALNPGRVRKLVIVDAAPEIAASGAQRVFRTVQSNRDFADPEEAVQYARRTNPRAPADLQRVRILANLRRRDDGRWTWRYDPVLRSPGRPSLSFDATRSWALLSNITCPTLFVRGAESDIISPEIATRVAAAIPSCRLAEVPACGHNVYTDNPGGFFNAVRDFMALP